MIETAERRKPDIDVSRLAIGEIVDREFREILKASGLRYNERVVAVGDESDPEAWIMQGVADLYEEMLRQNPDMLPPQKGQGYSDMGSYDAESVLEQFDPKTNPAWEWFYLNGLPHTSMLDWRKLMPSARALYPMQRLHDAARAFKKLFPDGYEVDEWAMNIFTNMIDCIGLRTRARIMGNMLLNAAERSDQQELVCVSLGCGAAVPNIDATVKIRETLGKDIKWDLYDTDEDALAFARELAADEGIELDEDSMKPRSYFRAFSLEKESVDVVDVLGLWEYLTDDQCVKLLKKSYDLLKPGGVFIASNMLTSRRQLEFNQRAVGWPDIYPRSIEQLLAIVERAGIPTELLTITTAQDGVYGVMEIKKP